MPRPLWSPLFLLKLVLLVRLALVPIEAQLQQAPLCLPSTARIWNWTSNSFNQTPCQTAAYLAAGCNSGFTIPPLTSGNRYTGPSGADECRCNSVFYSLICACAGCQKSPWIPYNQWHANCSHVSPVSTFPQKITNNTLVPAWAFVNVSEALPWDNVTACAVGNVPESSGTSRPPFAPKFDTGDAIRVGAIIGAAVGATALVFLIIGAGAWYLVRRYRWKRRGPRATSLKAPLTQYDTVEQESDTYEIPPLTPEANMKLYDPSDPRTYPDIKALPPGAMSPRTPNSATPILDSTTTKSKRPTEYSGLPEI